MFFNSLDFAIFLPIVFIIYWFVTNKNHTVQNILIVVSSYIFYGWWDWRFLSLIILSTLLDYFVCLGLKNNQNAFKRKLLLTSSIVINIGILGFFKYYNFFLDSFISAFSFFGREIQVNSLNIILPVGISFYTFQTLSYTIDVYRKKLEPTSDVISFAAFVSFFPQLVAGPIERATNLLPQFYFKRTFDYAEAIVGLRQILWGLFMKVVIADNCAIYANEAFNSSSELNGSTLILGAFFFTFQIYGDFAGYSNIAIGTAQLFGFNLMKNFNFPYFSRDIAEFWRRWHISLSTWFRDYLYFPLGGSRGSTRMKVRNVFIIFIVSGFWHGANWTFIVWGALNAVYFLPLLLTNQNRKNLDTVANDKLIPSINEVAYMTTTFILTVLAWVFFRAASVSDAITYLSGMFSYSIFSLPEFSTNRGALTTILLVVIFMIIEWLGRDKDFAIAKIGITKIGSVWNRFLRYACYYVLVFLIFWYGGNEQEFIYFQF